MTQVSSRALKIFMMLWCCADWSSSSSFIFSLIFIINVTTHLLPRTSCQKHCTEIYCPIKPHQVFHIICFWQGWQHVRNYLVTPVKYSKIHLMKTWKITSYYYNTYVHCSISIKVWFFRKKYCQLPCPFTFSVRYWRFLFAVVLSVKYYNFPLRVVLHNEIFFSFTVVLFSRSIAFFLLFQ